MKNIILIFILILPIWAFGQDYRVIDWKTNVENIQNLGVDTFKFDAEPIDYNDPGAITREIGNYFIDFVARCFKIIDSDATTITVVDLEHINSAPQSNQIGRVYQSVVDADSLFESIGGVDISVLDDLSKWRDVARNNEIICRLLKELYLKDATYRQKTDHDSLSALDEKSYNSLTDKPTSLPASDVYPWAKAATKPTYTKSEVGLSNVDNTSDANKPISTATQTALNTLVPFLGADRDVDLGANSISTDTVKIDGTPLLLKTFKQGNLGGAGNIFYSTGASSQPASGSVNQVVGNNYIQNQNSIPQIADVYLSGAIQSMTGVSAPKLSVGSIFDTDQNGSVWYGMTNRAFYGVDVNGYYGLNFNVGSGNAIKINYGKKIDVFGQINSTIPTGTPPLVVASSTKVDNLNVELLDGLHSTSFAKTAFLGQANIDTYTAPGLYEYDPIPTGTPPLQSSNLRVLSMGNNYRTTQMAFDYDSDRAWFRRNTNGVWAGWNEFWHTGNDGTGSTLDADMLDGKHASDFQLKSDTLTFDATLSDLADSSAAIRSLANTKATVSGTDNYIPKITGANTLGNSLIQDNGTAISIGLPVQNNNKFQSVNNIAAVGASELGGSEIGAQTYNYWNTPTYTGSFLRQYGSGATGTVAGISSKNLGALVFQNTDTSYIYTNGMSPIVTGVYSTPVNILNADGNSGFGTLTPAARIHSQSAGTQARLGYDATKYTDLSTGSTGNLTIDPTGDTVKVVGAVNSTGGFSTTAKSNLNDVIGDSAVFANMKMTYGAGLNKIIYGDANGNFVWGNQSSTLLAIAGVTPSTGYLYYNGSNFSYASGGSAQWTADTYGIKYTAGKVGIGIGSNSGNVLTVGDGSTNTNIAISASSLNQRAIFATSSSNTAIVGQGGLDGVYGVGTRYGVQGSSSSGNGVRGASTNAAGISGTSTYSYGGEFSGLGVNISSGGLLINGTTRISSTGTFTPSNGASGSFTSADGKTITVTNGIITGIN